MNNKSKESPVVPIICVCIILLCLFFVFFTDIGTTVTSSGHSDETTEVVFEQPSTNSANHVVLTSSGDGRISELLRKIAAD